MATIPYDVARAFLSGKHARAGNFVSTGDAIYSYDMRLAHWEEWGIRETVVRDCTTERARAVSATTARHMKALDTVLGAEEHGFDYRP